jgi:hypothetical protein
MVAAHDDMRQGGGRSEEGHIPLVVGGVHETKLMPEPNA